MSACATCGTELPPPARISGRPRKFCSERCRKRQYDLACVDCGARVSGTDPGSRNGREPRCRGCRARETGAERIVWTRETVIAAIRDWNDLYGEPPAVADWRPYHTEHVLGDRARAERWRNANGRWPSSNSVRAVFGSWAAGLTAAGFTPRAPHGTTENQARSRRFRETVVA